MDKTRPESAASPDNSETRALRRLELAEAALDTLIAQQEADQTVSESAAKKVAQDLIKAQAALSYERQKHEQDLRKRTGRGPGDIDFAFVRDQVRQQLDRIRTAGSAGEFSDATA